MKTLLYITAHPINSYSNSVTVGNKFIETYREANPEDEIVHLDLYKEDIPEIDFDLLRRWGQPPSGESFDGLSDESKVKAVRMRELVEQFVAADKIIIANPVWNLMFPPVLKSYIDTIFVPGITVKPANNGMRGLGGLVGTAQGKKVVHIQASGTILSYGEFEKLNFGDSYLRAVLTMLGIEDFQTIYVEGMAQYKDQADEIKSKALLEATELAKKF